MTGKTRGSHSIGLFLICAEGVAVLALEVDVDDIPVEDELKVCYVPGAAAVCGLVRELVRVLTGHANLAIQ